MRDPHDIYMNTLVPMVVEQTNRGERAFDIYSRLLQRAHHFRDWRGRGQHGVADRGAAAVPRIRESEEGNLALHQFARRRGDIGPGDLRHHAVHPPGRSPRSAWGRLPRWARCCSTAGEPGMRASLPNSRIMVHQPSGGFQGQVTDILIHAKEVESLKRRLNEIYVKHTGRSYEEIENGARA